MNTDRRNLTTTSGDVTLKVPKLKAISFETAIIERYRQRESSVDDYATKTGIVSATRNYPNLLEADSPRVLKARSNIFTLANV